nr:RelA/SpoT domain-containing protein [Flexivirga meconopsidis]
MPGTQDDELMALVERAYDERHRAWLTARHDMSEWLQQVCDELLAGADRTRLDSAHSRIKEQARALDKLRQKVADEDLTVDTTADVERELTDLVGLKVLCKSTRDQAAVFDALRDTDRLGDLRLYDQRDYVAAPKRSGYRACHVLFEVPVLNDDPVVVEVQIKTRLQDAWGELTHEDLYKPGSAMKPIAFHGSVARAMASLLAEVDLLADDLAEELEATADAQGLEAAAGDVEPAAAQDDFREVRVRTTGERYALAVDSSGQQGLIPAYAVRSVVGVNGLIKVDHYVEVGDKLRVQVEENDRGLYYLPVELVPH